jgi:hypothetical protein
MQVCYIIVFVLKKYIKKFKIFRHKKFSVRLYHHHQQQYYYFKENFFIGFTIWRTLTELSPVKYVHMTIQLLKWWKICQNWKQFEKEDITLRSSVKARQGSLPVSFFAYSSAMKIEVTFHQNFSWLSPDCMVVISQWVEQFITAHVKNSEPV